MDYLGAVMKELILIVALATLFSCSGCNTGKKQIQSINSNGIVLSVEPGEHWKGRKYIFLSRTPQMAAWLEDNQGQYVSTITVTNRSAKNNWLGNAPKEGRPEALPVWNYKIRNNTAGIDSVSSATTKGAVEVQIDNSSLQNGQEYNVYLEINHSFDYNDTWPKKDNDVNGQPSLIYHAKFLAGTSGRKELKPIGHGSQAGSDGKIVENFDGMTTALTIIKFANIVLD
jgi:hypothetical protein